ncbi:NAD(P)(+) transhydrogenase (Re/Si-specific) subunit beta [Algimonas porphyrae]|uniref:NAD(P) transhydrogenase subunit beta n=1 Tax=Algimonas porphyrae TaxID=1128113 RepID=A0ABQ5UYW2_9PROT|nr:NAD(P)(+) transhydrogenase (Re/Si-specific) subunit beta [Algimonas porphyrae]GLQ19619.1 NAD(P) transhydrogenase subunit beta [Algimonas porphyrae]
MIQLSADVAAILYTVSAILFILALRGLSSPETSRRGNYFGMIGIAIAIVTTVLVAGLGGQGLLLAGGGLAVGGVIGAIIARKIPMTDMPQLVAAFHSLVGLAAVLVALAAFFSPHSFGILGADGLMKAGSLLELSLGAGIGAITFTGSLIAFAKLNGNMSGSPILLPARHLINIALGVAFFFLVGMMMSTGGAEPWMMWALIGVTLILGFTLIIPIGGADMPVVVSMLNSYSGWAAAALGFTLGNLALIIVGALVGSSGAILSYIMCKGMNRSFISVILGGFGGDTAAAQGDRVERPFKRGSAEDAAFIMKNASKVIIVPGYGLAVAQAQHATREMADTLKEAGVDVAYAIHPVAGRMPGHMNVLLAEANVPYDEVFELEDINSEFANADVAFVIGANDVTNPAAKTDPQSPIAGMPILDVDKAATVLFVKRSLSPGYAGIDNDLFYEDNTMMLLSDAKKMVEEIIKAL